MKKAIFVILLCIASTMSMYGQYYKWATTGTSSGVSWITSSINENGWSFLVNSGSNGYNVGDQAITGASVSGLSAVDPSGKVSYLKKIPANVYQVAGDGQNNCYVAFNKSANSSDPIYVGTDTVLRDNVADKVLFVKLDQNGKVLWNKQMKNPFPTVGFKYYTNTLGKYFQKVFAIDPDNNVYFLVFLDGECTIDGITYPYGTNLFKYSSSGTLLYSKPISYDILSMACDHEGSLIVTGNRHYNSYNSVQAVDFGNNVTLTFPLVNNTFQFYTAKYDKFGTALWAAKPNSNYVLANMFTDVILKGVVIDQNNAPHLYGTFNCDMIYQGDTVPRGWAISAFLVKLNKDGVYQWSKSVRDTSAKLKEMEIRMLDFGPKNEMVVFMRSTYRQWSLFGNKMPRVGVSGSSDRTVAVMDSNLVLQSYRYLSNGETNNVTPSMRVTPSRDIFLVSGSGAITITTIDTTTTMPIIDSTALNVKMMTPTVIKFGMDAPTTVLQKVNTTPSAVTIYPNPASDRISIRTAFDAPCTVEIFNTLGQRLLQTSQTENIPIGQLPNGMYLLRVKTPHGITNTERFLKK